MCNYSMHCTHISSPDIEPEYEVHSYPAPNFQASGLPLQGLLLRPLRRRTCNSLLAQKPPPAVGICPFVPEVSLGAGGRSSVSL